MCAIPSAVRRCGYVAVISLSIFGSLVLTASEDDGEPRERVIMLSSGRVLTGVATRNAGGWLVEQGNGRVHVPIDQVTFVAANMIDAYRQQRDSVVEPTPATHVALAQWCISYRLYDEARDELRKCLKLDPDHTAGRKMLHRVDELLEPTLPKPAAPATLRTTDGFLVPDVESLGGLSNEAAVGFSQRIQPLLMNKCGNVSCHGSTNRDDNLTGFHLIPVRNGSNSHRLYTERNLAEVMRQIDIHEPAQSPLAAVPQGSHAGTAGIFHGSNGNAQLKMLRTWIKTVASEKQADEAERAARPSVTSKGRKPSAMAGSKPPALLDADEGDDIVPAAAPDKPLNKVVTAHFSEESAPPFKANADSIAARRPAPLPGLAEEPKAAAKEVKKSESKDPDKPSDDLFDPDVFNRRFHGRKR